MYCTLTHDPRAEASEVVAAEVGELQLGFVIMMVCM